MIRTIYNMLICLVFVCWCNSVSSFYDPHNHIRGIPSSIGLSNPIKYIKNELHKRLHDKTPLINLGLSEEEIANNMQTDLVRLAKWLSVDTKDKRFNSRQGTGSRAAMACSLEKYNAKQAEWDGHAALFIERVLSATPWTSFDAAYAKRGDVVDTYISQLPDIAKGKTPVCEKENLSDKDCAEYVFALLTVFELIRTKIDTVEISMNFAGENKPKRLKKITYVKRILSYIFESKVSSEPSSIDVSTAEGLYKAIKVFASVQDIKESLSIKWLLMINTAEMSAVNPEKTQHIQQYSSAKKKDKDISCENIPLSKKIITVLNKDNSKSYVDTLLNNYIKNDIAGVDVAAPERNCFTDYGVNKWRDFIITLIREFANKKDQETSDIPGKLLIHVHVGEGARPSFVLNEYEVYYSDGGGQEPTLAEVLKKKPSDNCSYFKKLPPKLNNYRASQEEFNRDVDVYERMKKQAQVNIKKTLDAIETIRKNFDRLEIDIDKYVLFRLGHVTHITLESAKKMRKLKLWADVNLSSNISTGAMLPAIGIREKLAPLREYIRDLKPEERIDQERVFNRMINFLKGIAGITYADLFAEHGLLKLIQAEVLFTLGSDGGGVERSNLETEYKILEELIDGWQKDNLIPPDISLQNIQAYQDLYLDVISSENNNYPDP